MRISKSNDNQIKLFFNGNIKNLAKFYNNENVYGIDISYLSSISDMFNIDTSINDEMFNSFPNLGKLSIHTDIRLTGSEFHKLKNLRKLFLNQCNNISHDSLIKLKQIEKLVLVWSDIDDKSFSEICSLPNLKYLRLICCNYISDMNIRNILNNNNLKSVVFDSCEKINFDTDLEKFVNSNQDINIYKEIIFNEDMEVSKDLKSNTFRNAQFKIVRRNDKFTIKKY
jgi:hypothetical protein